MPPSSKDLVAYTPMLHARLFSETPKFRGNHFQPLRTPLASHPDPADPPKTADAYLDGNPSLDRPLFVQFCSNEPEELLKAAKYVAPYCDAVDLNLGCPQGIARKGHYGAFLQEDQDLIYRLINKLHLELDVPVTAKIRILETREKTLAYAKNVLDAGASILTVHGRVREQKGHNTGLADWSVIRYLRETLPKDTVLFANGNILRKEDVDRCLEETGADGVMSAEGNLYDPSLFADPPEEGEREYWVGKDGKGGWRMDAVMRRYLGIVYKHVLEVAEPVRKPLYLPSDPVDPVSFTESEEVEDDGPPRKKQKKEKKERSTNPSHIAMQPHLFKLLRPLVSKHHHVRDALARCRAGDIEAFENVLQLVEGVVKEGLKRYHETDGQSWEEESAADERIKAAKIAEAVARTNELIAKAGVRKADVEGAEAGEEMDESSLATVKACRRPWWVVQPYVRPLPAEALAKGALALSKKDLAKLVKQEEEKAGGKAQGHTEAESVGKGMEKVEVPKDGLVCG